MLIKKLIQRLLDSRTTPEEAGHSAMPSASETVLLTQNDAFQSWGNIHQGVAADDGYVNIFARSVNNTTSEMRVLTSGMTFSSAQTGAEKDMACSAPVAKGQTYTIKGVQVKGIKIIFVKTLGAIVGGGYNSVIRRALSCLRALSNFLQRSFCKASILTLLTNVGRVQQYRTKTFREEVNKISLPHLVVGPCFRLEGLMTSPISGSDLKTPQERLAISLTSLVGGNGPRSRYRRVTQSLWILASTRVRGILLLFATNRLNSLRTGGALC